MNIHIEYYYNPKRQTSTWWLSSEESGCLNLQPSSLHEIKTINMT